jgi:hypothetical protein
MFKDISDFHSINSENRKSLIIIEEINVANHKFISFVFIIQRQKLMQHWVQFELFAKTLIKTFKNEFINDQIIIEWLKYFINHTNFNSLKRYHDKSMSDDVLCSFQVYLQRYFIIVH